MKAVKAHAVLYKVKLVFQLVVLSILSISGNAYAVSEPSQRLSFAISGGASLGAYEAGINWGLLTLMRYETQKDNDFSNGIIRPYEAASMTGASAGSINALLSGLTWCARHESDGGFPNRIDNNLFRNVWLSLDINHLLPENATAAAYRNDDAVLSRKDLLDSANMLRQTWNSPFFRKDCHVPLGVTLTRVFPELLQVGDIEVKNQRFTIPFELKVKEDLSVGFYFNPEDYYYHSDHSMILLPNEQGNKNYEISDQRVTQAVLTSSAFPLAFGRKRLQYCRLRLLNRTSNANANTLENSRLKGLSCPEGYELIESEFADGGLFDNLPIGLARTLSENNTAAKAAPFPTTYIYLDPDRLRYESPYQQTSQQCTKENAPHSCEEMEYGFLSEIHLLVDAFGTARNYELYRELSSDTWAGNVTLISRQFSELLKTENDTRVCNESLPYFSEQIRCIEALKYTGKLLETAYTHSKSPVLNLFSIVQLQNAGLIQSCTPILDPETNTETPNCYMDYEKFRSDYTGRLLSLANTVQPNNANLLNSIRNSQSSINNDRSLKVTSRGAPIVGKLLGAFAAFLDYKFREYDYYVGVYDSVILASQTLCEQQHYPHNQAEEYHQCQNTLSKRFYKALGFDTDTKGKYLFALLAKSEFGSKDDLQFAYKPMPKKNNDIDAIYNALIKTHSPEEQEESPANMSTEVEFFYNLKMQGFTPTENADKQLMAEIMEDPDTWAYELTRRFTNRLNHLENESGRILAERDADSQQYSNPWSGVLGGASYTLRAATYKYPSFDFSPSTAPRDWIARNIFPYEVAVDLLEGDVLLSWQPTWSISKYNNLGIRVSVGIADGLVRTSDEEGDESENYYAVGMDYTNVSSSEFISSWGITPTYYKLMESPESGKKDSFGGDIHVGFLQNRVRLAIGNKGTDDPNDNWYFLIGLADLPGLIYWFSR